MDLSKEGKDKFGLEDSDTYAILQESLPEIAEIAEPSKAVTPEKAKPAEQKVEKKVPAEGKEVWEMTREKYLKTRLGTRNTFEQIEAISPGKIGDFSRLHKAQVFDALKRNDNVPPEVLKDYPDLAEIEIKKIVRRLVPPKGGKEKPLTPEVKGKHSEGIKEKRTELIKEKRAAKKEIIYFTMKRIHMIYLSWHISL